jgi:glutamyl-tRNA synthetase
MTLRVRFAPSPTGYLHVGGARTALFNWLLARQQSGVFVLRIEDTDRERSSDEHTQVILEGLSWLGIEWDVGPLFQSEGVERHRADALRLLEEGKAYRDFADPAVIRAEAEQRGVNASQVAREKAQLVGEEESGERAAAGEVFAVRFRVPDGETLFTDSVHGDMRFGNADIDDLVILRGDGTPVYNLAVVSDDAHMRITHVIRGDDHLSNTPKQVLLYRALGLPEPVFGHVPLILGPDGKRLSKRHGATAIGEYASQGLLPVAMVNFLALLGWSPGDDREIMEFHELVAAFSMERVLKKSSVFDSDKLMWLNGKKLAVKPASELLATVGARLEAVPGVDRDRLEDAEWMGRVVDLIKSRVRTIDDLADHAVPFIADRLDYEEKAVTKHWAKDPEAARDRLEAVAAFLADAEWTAAELEEGVRGLAEVLGISAGKMIHPLRVALTGRMSSPGIFEVLVLLGRDCSLVRIEQGIARTRDL